MRPSPATLVQPWQLSVSTCAAQLFRRILKNWWPMATAQTPRGRPTGKDQLNPCGQSRHRDDPSFHPRGALIPGARGLADLFRAQQRSRKHRPCKSRIRTNCQSDEKWKPRGARDPWSDLNRISRLDIPKAPRGLTASRADESTDVRAPKRCRPGESSARPSHRERVFCCQARRLTRKAVHCHTFLQEHKRHVPYLSCAASRQANFSRIESAHSGAGRHWTLEFDALDTGNPEFLARGAICNMDWPGRTTATTICFAHPVPRPSRPPPQEPSHRRIVR